MSNWYDHDNADKVTRSGAWRIMLWVTLFAVFFAGLGWLLWGLGVLGAPVKGAGDAYKQKESANNRVFQQAYFEDIYQEYESTVNKIKPAKQAVKQNPDATTKQTELTGLINHCYDVVADYNSQSRKYLAVDFKSSDLPATLDANRCF